ncbi:MAG: GrpB family protein, partial [Clostridiales bacterium]|nr:GrpB family protein [Clostridiales bacterium]
MRLIFVEGVSGVGKTTMTGKLRDKLRNMGFAADCYFEGDFANPIDFYCTAYFKQDEYADLLAKHGECSKDIENRAIAAGDIRLVRYRNRETPLFPEPLLNVFREHEFVFCPSNIVPVSEYARVYKSVWEQFAHKADRHSHLDYLIFDGSMLHHPVNDMMRNYNASCDQVVSHINALVETVERFRPQLLYLSSDSVAERLRKAQTSRKKAPPSSAQIQFWEKRERMDIAAMQRLSIQYGVFNISLENWDSAIDEMAERVLETDAERQVRIYPIVLSEYNSAWPEWFAEEKDKLEQLIGIENIARINHCGSTSVPGLTAKPTIDILLEINETTDIDKLINALPSPEYICLSGAGLTMPTPPPHLTFIKGYLANGFAEKVYHIHVVYPGDHDELLFRDYLIARPGAAAEYAELKRRLFQDYEHDRDGYT